MATIFQAFRDFQVAVNIDVKAILLAPKILSLFIRLFHFKIRISKKVS